MAGVSNRRRAAAAGGGSNPGRAVLAAIAVVLGAVSVGSPSGAHPASEPPVSDPGRALCHPLAVSTCVLPFPSDDFTVADANSATGVRPSVAPELLTSGVFEALPASFQPSTFFDAADGFSPLGAVSFETAAAVDAAALVADPGRYLSAVDRDTGAALPVLVDVPEDGAGRLLRVWPRARWPFGHRVTVSVAAALPSASGAPLARPAGWRDAEIPTTAFSRNGTLTSTTFTVRSESNVRDDTASMAAAAWEADHPLRRLTVTPSLLPHIRAVVQGQVRLSDFRTAGGEIDLADPGPPTDRWVDFELFYPERPLRDGGAPIVMYGHGVGIVKETALLVAPDNAQRGWATVAIDQPNHGERRATEGALLDLVEPASLGRVTSMVTQSSVDFVSLQKALRTSFAELDVVSSSGFFLFSARPDGRTDFDPSAMIYQGTSMGGVLGAAFLSITPEPLPAALLQVPGVGVSHIITNSLLWDGLLGFRDVVPEAATPGEASALMAAAQMALDPGDAGNWIDVAVDNGTRLMVDYGLGDGIVPNESTERLLEIAGIPLVGPVVEPVAHLGSAPAVTARSASSGPWTGATQVPVTAPNPQLLEILGHLAFLQPRAVAAQGRWMDAVDAMFRE